MKWITIGFVIILLLIVAAANLGLEWSLFAYIYSVPFGDKIGHFILTGLFSLLLNLTLQPTRVRILSFRILKGTLIVLGLVTLEEFSQIFFKYRNFSLLDLASDFAGILVFGCLAGQIVDQRRRLAAIEPEEQRTPAD